MRQIWSHFMMPMFILAMRVESEIIFKMNYRVFMGNKGQSSGPKGGAAGAERGRGSQHHSTDIKDN